MGDKVKCNYCGRTIAKNIRPYRDTTPGIGYGWLYHRGCYVEMTQDIQRYVNGVKVYR